MRSLWIDIENDEQQVFNRAFRILSFKFLRENAVSYIYSSRKIKNTHSLITYRYTLERALHNPHSFSFIKLQNWHIKHSPPPITSNTTPIYANYITILIYSCRLNPMNTPIIINTLFSKQAEWGIHNINKLSKHNSYLLFIKTSPYFSLLHDVSNIHRSDWNKFL